MYFGSILNFLIQMLRKSGQTKSRHAVHTASTRGQILSEIFGVFPFKICLILQNYSKLFDHIRMSKCLFQRIISRNKASELKLTHQATANRWPLSAHMVPGVAALFFVFWMDVRTPHVKIMTTNSAVAWWVNWMKNYKNSIKNLMC